MENEKLVKIRLRKKLYENQLGVPKEEVEEKLQVLGLSSATKLHLSAKVGRHAK